DECLTTNAGRLAAGSGRTARTTAWRGTPTTSHRSLQRSEIHECPLDDFPITPPMIVKDTPQPRWLMTIKEGCDYVDEAMRLGRAEPWSGLWHRLSSLASHDEAVEAIGDLRELPESEDSLLPDGG